MRALLLSIVFLAGCLHDDLRECGMRLCPIDRVCAHGTCVEPAQLVSCQGLTEDASCSFDDRQGHCRSGICEAVACGDDRLDAPEQCDGTDLGGATCLTHGYYTAAGLTCSADCSVDTSQCVGRCGDGIANGPELCDTTPGDAFTCYEVGFDFGSVRCSQQLCAPVYDGCVKIGWREGPQQGDYTEGGYSPRAGNVYIVNGAENGDNYLHATGVTRIRVAAPPGCANYNSGIWASDNDEVFLAGTSQVCRHVGTTWTIFPMPQGVEVTRVWGTSASDVYAVGSAVMHFDGTTWSVVDTGSPSGASFKDIAGRVGGKVVIGTSTGGLAIYDQGWTYEVVDAAVSIRRVWTSPNETIYVVANDSLYTKTNGVWSSSIPSPLTEVRGVWGVSDAGVYLLGSSQSGSGAWFFDGQLTFDVRLPNDTYSYFGGGPNSLLAVAGYSHFYESSGYFFTTYSQPRNVASLWAFSRSNIVALDSANDLWRFDGTAWTQSSPFTVSVSALWAANPNAIVAIGSAGQAATFNGTNWTSWNVAPESLLAVWGEAADRVFATSLEYHPTYALGVIHMFDGAGWQQVYTAPVGLGSLGTMWGSAAAGTFIVEPYTDKLLHLPPGSAPTAWTELTMPDTDATGIWGSDTKVIVTFSDGRAWAFENGAWTSIPTRELAAARSLSGPPGDVYGISPLSALIHWDGTVWDRVRLPPEVTPNGVVAAVFSGNGVVAVVASDAVSFLLQP